MGKLLLIGGASHTGKSTLAAKVASLLDCAHVSTDRLARHPGRPWPRVRPHVVEHYLRLSNEAIFEFLLVHHENMWPRIRDMIVRHLDGGHGRIVLEGSALRPEYVVDLIQETRAVWLTASDAFIRERIHRESRHSEASPEARSLIDRFTDRSIMDNQRIIEAVDRLGLDRIDVEHSGATESFVGACLVGPFGAAS